MDLTPRQRADIVHVVLANAETLGLKVSMIVSDYSGRRVSAHLDRDTASHQQGRALFDSLNPTGFGGGSHFPGSPSCPPYSTIIGRAPICGVDIEVQIFTDFASPPLDPDEDDTPDPECTGCGSQHCAGCDAVPAGQPAQQMPAEPAGSVTE